MQVLGRWRNLMFFEATIFQSVITGTAISSKSNGVFFHSTDASYEKWKNKFNFGVRSNQLPSKDYVRYVVRQKRADTKKALKNLLFNVGCSTSRAESFFKVGTAYEDQLNKKSRIKPARQARRAYHKKLKRKQKRENLCEDFDENTKRIFQGTSGKRCFEWTFKPWEMGFDWREPSGWNNSTYQEHDSKSRIEYDDESFVVGTYADRRILGLPITGPLKMDDVKSAFRRSALKWHPDKHQGPSQADAEEKFKICAKAYKSLCNALSAA